MDIRETLINGYWKVYLIIAYSIYIDLCHGDFIVYVKFIIIPIVLCGIWFVWLGFLCFLFLFFAFCLNISIIVVL
jgi:hypothetical protein